MYRLGDWARVGVTPNVLLQAVRWRSADTWRYMEKWSYTQWSQDTASDGWKVEINILIDI